MIQVLQKNNTISIAGILYQVDDTLVAANPSGNLVSISYKYGDALFVTDYDKYEDANNSLFGANPGQVVTALNALFSAENPAGLIKSTDKITALADVDTFDASNQGYVLLSSTTAVGGITLKPLQDILASNEVLTSVVFDLVNPDSLSDGRLAYDSDKETLVFQSEHGELAIGEGYKPVYNNTGSTIAKGAAVKATGVSGEKFLIELFDASSGVDEELYFIGVTQAAINDQSAGIVVSEGYVKHLDTSSYSVGNILYASETAGALTNTKPTSPNLGIPVAMVTKVDATNGTIYVRPTIYAHLDEMHDVLITSPTEDNILTYDSNQNYWYNNTLAGIGGVTSVNSVAPSSGNVTLDTDDISEGSTNEYYTDAKVDARITAVVNEVAPVVSETASIVLEDDTYDNKFVVINSATSVDVEMEGHAIYNGWEAGTEFYFMQGGVGEINLVSLGPVFKYPSDKSLMSRTQNSVIGMKCIVAPTSSTPGYWAIFGDLKDA